MSHKRKSQHLRKSNIKNITAYRSKTLILLGIFVAVAIIIMVSIYNIKSTQQSTHKHQIEKLSATTETSVAKKQTSTSTSPVSTSVSTSDPISPVFNNGAVKSLVGFNAPLVGYPVQSQSTSAVVSISDSPTGFGYVILRENGQVETFDFQNYGSTPNLPMGDTATGIAVDSNGNGYWVVTSFGTVYNFGNAPKCGSPNIPTGGWGQYPAAIGIYSNKSDINSTNGYYVLRANGEVDGFCGAKVESSLQLPYYTTAPVVATSMSVDQKTGGYWILTSQGQVYSYNAPNLSSPPQAYNGNSTVSITSLPNASGYWILSANGEVEAFGDAINYGSLNNAMPSGSLASSIEVDPQTNGYWAVFDWSPRSTYLNPFRDVTSLVPQEIDQGVDYCGSGPIYAIGAGIVVNVYSSGWPSGVFIAYKLTSGIAQGYIVYVAENVSPNVTIGEQVTSNSVIGTVHDALTCMETGWASLTDFGGFAAAKSEYNGSNSTALGINFSKMLQDLGSRPGLVQPNGSPGTIPTYWPTI